MSTSVETLLEWIAEAVQEDTDFSNGFWSTNEIRAYINDVCKSFVLDTQILKIIDAIAAVTAQRIYDQNSYTSQIDRIAFNNTALDRTTKFSLDHKDIKWRTLAGIPKQYHQDQLPVQQFEVDRATTSGQVGSGYTANGLYGTVRMAFGNATTVSDAGMNSPLALLNSATANFTATDVGKNIIVSGAGAAGANLVTTISAFTSATQVTLAAAASTTVVGVVATWGTLYGNSGNYGLVRYWYGTAAINGILPRGTPYAGTIRQMLTGLTNFEILTTRLVDDITTSDEPLRVPDFTLLYIKYGVLYIMLAKEGEHQDMARALYAKARYERGVQLFRKLMGVKTKDEVMSRV